MARKAMAGWMLVGTGVGIAAAIVGTQTMRAQNKKGLKNNMKSLKSEAVSMIKDELGSNAAQVAKKTGDVLIKASNNMGNSIKN